MAKESFEKNLARLEEIVARLEGGESPLDESMKLFEEGIRLSRLCAERLDKAEMKIRMLTRDDQGELREVPFEADED